MHIFLHLDIFFFFFTLLLPHKYTRCLHRLRTRDMNIRNGQNLFSFRENGFYNSLGIKVLLLTMALNLDTWKNSLETWKYEKVLFVSLD